ncbi:MAG TPA: hypothetical protein VFC44_07330 [Candidatus Saccharimonadales bacterium]|nr:hypothetical protein [Candidatus Saccharimonadales bacterium]
MMAARRFHPEISDGTDDLPTVRNGQDLRMPTPLTIALAALRAYGIIPL